MSQIALNTVALFVFCVTCMILFGPLVHLPAEIPVVFTLAGLTIATLDMVGFQGQGANLFLDWFAQRSPDYRDRVVHHEAGHFLVAYLLKIPILGYTLTASEALKAGYPGIGGVQLQKAELSTDYLDQVKDYCAICVAGRAAEKLSFQSIQGGGDDLAWLRSQLKALDLNAKLYEQEAMLKANRILKDNWEAYLRLVTSMKNRDSLQSCYAAISNEKSSHSKV